MRDRSHTLRVGSQRSLAGNNATDNQPEQPSLEGAAQHRATPCTLSDLLRTSDRCNDGVSHPFRAAPTPAGSGPACADRPEHQHVTACLPPQTGCFCLPRLPSGKAGSARKQSGCPHRRAPADSAVSNHSCQPKKWSMSDHPRQPARSPGHQEARPSHASHDPCPRRGFHRSRLFVRLEAILTSMEATLARSSAKFGVGIATQTGPVVPALGSDLPAAGHERLRSKRLNQHELRPAVVGRRVPAGCITTATADGQAVSIRHTLRGSRSTAATLPPAGGLGRKSSTAGRAAGTGPAPRRARL